MTKQSFCSFFGLLGQIQVHFATQEIKGKEEKYANVCKTKKKKIVSLSGRWLYSKFSTNNSNNKGSQCLANGSSPPNIPCEFMYMCCLAVGFSPSTGYTKEIEKS